MTTDAAQGPHIGPERQLAAPDPGHPPSRFRRRVLWSVALLAIAVVLALLWRLYEGTRAAPRAPLEIPVTTATAIKGSIGVYLEAIGTVTPVTTDIVTSQVSGLVRAVHFREGQKVAAGDLLIEIDPRPYRATLLQAQGALERDQGLLSQAQMDLSRYRESLALKAIARQIVDDQEKLVEQIQGTLKNDQGTVQYDQLQLDFCRITAPVGGRIGLRLVDPGNVILSAGATNLAVITQLQPMTVIFAIAEDSLPQVTAQMHGNARLGVDVFDRSGQIKLASGTLAALDSQIDTTTGTVKARAEFANHNEALYPNAFVNARLLVQTLQGVTLVPASAIQQNGAESFVYVLQGGFAHKRSVVPGVSEAGLTQVDGVAPGDALANSSFDKLQDKATVTVSAPTPATKPTSAPGPAQGAQP